MKLIAIVTLACNLVLVNPSAEANDLVAVTPIVLSPTGQSSVSPYPAQAQPQTAAPIARYYPPAAGYSTVPQAVAPVTYYYPPPMGYSAQPQVVRYQSACPTTAYDISGASVVPVGQPASVPAYHQPVTTTYRPASGKYYEGRGLLGQPKIYGRHQPLRNLLRFLTP